MFTPDQLEAFKKVLAPRTKAEYSTVLDVALILANHLGEQITEIGTQLEASRKKSWGDLTNAEA